MQHSKGLCHLSANVPERGRAERDQDPEPDHGENPSWEIKPETCLEMVLEHYGLAFGVVTAKGQDAGGEGSEGTFSWGGYFNTQYFADPVEQTIGILMKQTQGPVQ